MRAWFWLVLVGCGRDACPVPVHHPLVEDFFHGGRLFERITTRYDADLHRLVAETDRRGDGSVDDRTTDTWTDGLLVNTSRDDGADGRIDDSIDYVYDDLGRLVRAEDSAGITTTYGYDADDHLVDQRIDVGELSTHWQWLYEDGLLRRAITDSRSGGSTGHTEVAYEYDERRLLSRRVSGADETTYAWTDDGRELSEESVSGGAWASSVDFSYGFDGRLQRRVSREDVDGDEAADAVTTDAFGYDVAGNVTRQHTEASLDRVLDGGAADHEQHASTARWTYAGCGVLRTARQDADDDGRDDYRATFAD